jgi:hypothetical protein
LEILPRSNCVSESLVVEKSGYQLSLEARLRLLLPVAVGGVAWLAFGPLPVNALLVLLTSHAVAPVGQWIASSGPGERLDLAEYWRRALERGLALSPWRSFLASAQNHFVLTLVVLLPALPWQVVDDFPGTILLIAAPASLVLGAADAGRRRRWRNATTNPEKPRALSRRLADYLPMHYGIFAGSLIGGYYAAAHVATPSYRHGILFAALYGAFAVEMLLISWGSRRPPAPERSAPFGWALAIGFLQYGVTFGAFALLYSKLGANTSPQAEWEQAAIGAACGTLYVLLRWALGRLYGWGSGEVTV